MPVHSKHLPADVAAEIVKHAHLIFPKTGALSIDAKSFPWGQKETHEIYFADLDACAQGKAVRGARHVGWRMLVHYADGSSASVELGFDAEKRAMFHGVNRGPYVGSTMAALNAGEKLSAPGERELEARMIKAPSLYVAAIWFHDDAEPVADLVMPLDPAPTGLTPGVAISVAEFEAEMQKLAQLRQTKGLNPTQGG